MNRRPSVTRAFGAADRRPSIAPYHVVISRPSSAPACASGNAPVHTVSVASLADVTAVSHFIIAGSLDRLLLLPPGITTRSGRGASSIEYRGVIWMKPWAV